MAGIHTKFGLVERPGATISAGKTPATFYRMKELNIFIDESEDFGEYDLSIELAKLENDKIKLKVILLWTYAPWHLDLQWFPLFYIQILTNVRSVGRIISITLSPNYYI